jgi:hypothetical protein
VAGNIHVKNLSSSLCAGSSDSNKKGEVSIDFKYGSLKEVFKIPLCNKFMLTYNVNETLYIDIVLKVHSYIWL